MTKHSDRRPSAGLILGTLALVVAMAGSAFAGGGTFDKITGKKVRKIVAQELENPALTVGKAKIATNVFSANVAAGQMVGSVPAGATSEKRELGGFAVNFGRPIAGCTISASLATPNNTLAQTGSASVRPSASNPNEVYVDTFNDAGARADRDIYVQLICPAG